MNLEVQIIENEETKITKVMLLFLSPSVLLVKYYDSVFH